MGTISSASLDVPEIVDAVVSGIRFVSGPGFTPKRIEVGAVPLRAEDPALASGRSLSRNETEGCRG
jgi:hypothetical protein